MSEYCPDCFLALNPEYKKSDLIIIKDPDLCEGCGKIVKECVLDVKKQKSRKE